MTELIGGLAVPFATSGTAFLLFSPFFDVGWWKWLIPFTLFALMIGRLIIGEEPKKICDCCG